MASMKYYSIEEVLDIVTGEQSEDDGLDWNQSECFSEEECIDYMPVWDPHTPLYRAQEDSSASQ